MNRKTMAGILGLMMLAGTAAGQVAQIGGGTAPLNGQWMKDATDFGDCYISEVWVDPQDGDDSKEYIELWSPECNYVLNGKMIVVIADSSGGATEVEESYIFPAAGSGVPTYMTNEEGIFVLWNSDDDREVAAINTADSTYQSDMEAQAAASDIYESLPTTVRQTSPNGVNPGPTPDIGELSIRYEASFDEIGTNGTGSNDWPGQLSNEDSKTILLIDLDETGLDSTEVLKLHKDRNPDGDNDGFIEDGEVGSGTGDYLCVIDAVSHSHNGGSEYTPYEGQEWDYSPGFNADAWVRVGTVTTATSSGSLISSCGGGSDTYRQSYRNWMMGEVSNIGSGSSLGGEFDNICEHFGGVPDPGASSTVNVGSAPDYTLDTSVVLTPGEPNDSAPGMGYALPASSCVSPLNGIRGDLNFDGVVDYRDVQMAVEAKDVDMFMSVINNLR